MVEDALAFTAGFTVGLRLVAVLGATFTATLVRAVTFAAILGLDVEALFARGFGLALTDFLTAATFGLALVVLLAAVALGFATLFMGAFFFACVIYLPLPMLL
jgi:hypothetical protein